MVAQLINVSLRLFPEPLEQETAIMFVREDVRSLSVTSTLAHTDLVKLMN